MQQRSLLLILALAAASLPASATAINTGSWYHILTTLNTNATGGPDGTPTYFAPGAPPWTFTLLSAGTLDLTDAQNNGDTYQVFNNNTLLTTTPQGTPFSPNISCGFDPTACFANTNFSHLVSFALAAGSYSLNFVAIDSPLLSSSAFFRVIGTAGNGTPPDPGNGVPEPSTYALTASAVLALALLKRR